MKAVLQYRASPGLRQQITALDFRTVDYRSGNRLQHNSRVISTTACVLVRHVADRDAVAARGVEVDRIDADPDLLDQPEMRRSILSRRAQCQSKILRLD
jgi:hypothetical protein